MKPLPLLMILICLMAVSSCTPPIPVYYVRNYSTQPLDIVIFYEKQVSPDVTRAAHVFPSLINVNKTPDYSKAIEHKGELLNDSTLKITIPAENSLAINLQGRSLHSESLKMALAVQNNILRDTLYVHQHPSYQTKFKVIKEPVFKTLPTYNMLYDYPQ